MGRSLGLVWLILLAGCGRGTSFRSVLPQFERYVQKFDEIAESQGDPRRARDIAVEFGELDGSTELGSCTTGFNVEPTVTVDRHFWEVASETQRLVLILHELGHCVLARGHDRTADRRGRYRSIMAPTLISDADFQAYQSSYERELFHPHVTGPGFL